MSHPVPATLYRIAAAAGIGSALVLLVNAAKRAEVIPTSPFTQLVAPLAQIMALAFVTGLYLAFGRRAGAFGLVAYLLNGIALAALIGVEFVINLVFSELPASTIEALRAGSLGIALTVASIAFLLGTLAFVTAMLRTRELPTVPLALYAIGAVPISLRAFVPEVVLDLGLAVLAVGIGWLAVWLFDRANRITSWTDHGEPAVPLEPITLAGIRATSVIFLAVTLVLMHVIQPGLNPAKHYVSEYALGQAGWLLMVAYVLAGAGVLGLAWSAGSILPGKRARAVGAGLVLVGLALIATGVTRIDIPAADGSVIPTASGTAHELAGYVAVVGLLPASFLVAGAFGNDPRLSGAARRAWIFAVAIVVALVVAVMSQPLDLAGVGQRIFLATLITWLVFVALQLSRVERPSTPSPPRLEGPLYL